MLIRFILTLSLALLVAACSNTNRNARDVSAREHSQSSPARVTRNDPSMIKESVVSASADTAGVKLGLAPKTAATRTVPNSNATSRTKAKSGAAATNHGLSVSLKDDATPAVSRQQQVPSKTRYDTVWQRLASELQFADMGRHREVEKIEQWYAEHSYYFRKVGVRAGRYLHFILARIEARGLPADLALLPLVESAYDPYAYSHGQAAGLWQFVPITARHVGLEQNWWYDGRRDVIASTEAALDYLIEMNARFDGDWLLTLAAYNSGAGTVNRAIAKNKKQGKPTDFWSLKLPKETKRYVPKLLAMVKIFQNPAAYNVSLPRVEDRPYFAIVATDGQVDLHRAAALADISVERISHLNPGLNRGVTPPKGPHRLLVPVESAQQFKQRLAEMPADERVRWRHYTVKRGDNLGSIARAHHIDIAALRSTNRLMSDVIRVGQELLIPSVSDNIYAAGVDAGEKQKRYYTVVSGDTLGHIAQRFDVSLSDLRRWNDLGSKSVIKLGQTLTVWTPGETGDGIVRKVGYRVRDGDSLYAIASRFKVKVSDIVEWNRISTPEYLQPGQSLTLFVDITRSEM